MPKESFFLTGCNPKRPLTQSDMFRLCQNWRSVCARKGQLCGRTGASLCIMITPPPTSFHTMKHINKWGMEILPHPPNSPDLAPCDFGFFQNWSLNCGAKGSGLSKNSRLRWGEFCSAGSHKFSATSCTIWSHIGRSVPLRKDLILRGIMSTLTLCLSEKIRSLRRNHRIQMTLTVIEVDICSALLHPFGEFARILRIFTSQNVYSECLFIEFLCMDVCMTLFCY